MSLESSFLSVVLFVLTSPWRIKLWLSFSYGQLLAHSPPTPLIFSCRTFYSLSSRTPSLDLLTPTFGLCFIPTPCSPSSPQSPIWACGADLATESSSLVPTNPAPVDLNTNNHSVQPRTVTSFIPLLSLSFFNSLWFCVSAWVCSLNWFHCFDHRR